MGGVRGSRRDARCSSDRRHRPTLPSRQRTFSGKIRCAQCRAWYGAKTWHAGSKYEKRIWRCNHKYSGNEKCATPHLTDQQIKDTFTQALQQLAARSKTSIDLDALVLERFETSDLEAKETALAGQVDAAATAIDDLIALNSREPLDQDEYQTRFIALADQHARLLAAHKLIADQTKDRQTRHRAYEHYQQQLTKLGDDHNVQFSPFRWHTLLDHAEARIDGQIIFIFRDGSISS